MEEEERKRDKGGMETGNKGEGGRGEETKEAAGRRGKEEGGMEDWFMNPI